MKAMQSAMAAHWNFKWAVIHINTGLHDIKYVDEKGELNTTRGKQVHTPEQYQQNLREVFTYLRGIAPDAHIIFATTTAVPENSNGRKAGDEVKYNQAALAVVKEFPGITINDLYTPTKANQPKWNVRPNNVHFKTPGSRALGKQVAQAILATWQTSPSP
jgi:lysophospholipase L1-like esterase